MILCVLVRVVDWATLAMVNMEVLFEQSEMSSTETEP